MVALDWQAAIVGGASAHRSTFSSFEDVSGLVVGLFFPTLLGARAPLCWRWAPKVPLGL